jgi:hypothetical protein
LCESAGHQYAKRDFKNPFPPLGLHPSTLQPLYTTIVNQHHVLDHLRLWPWRHPKEQHLFERPHVIR